MRDGCAFMFGFAKILHTVTPKSLGCRICRRGSRPGHWQRRCCTTNQLRAYVSIWWIVQVCCGYSTYRNVSDDRESKMPAGSSAISLIWKFLMMDIISIDDLFIIYNSPLEECWARERVAGLFWFVSRVHVQSFQGAQVVEYSEGKLGQFAVDQPSAPSTKAEWVWELLFVFMNWVYVQRKY